MKPILVLLAAVVIQACLGGVYGWSTFVPALKSEHEFTTGQTQIIFGLTIAAFALTMVWAGRLAARWGPRVVGFTGGVLFWIGYRLAALSGGSFPVVLTGIGLVAGASIGFGYVVALTTAVQWYPQRKGLVTGIAVTGFGGGAIILSSVVTRLFREGWLVLDIFRMMGWVGGVAVALASMFLFRPPRANQTAGADAVPYTLRGDRFFISLIVGMFCGTFSGLLVVGNLKPIGMDGGLSAEAAALAISFLAAGNALGRLVWGWIADRMGYKSIPFSLIFFAGGLGLLLVGRVSSWGFSAVALLVGIGFGACFVLYAAQVAARYGAAAVAKIYPLVFLAYGLAGTTGPSVGGFLFDYTASYVIPILVAIAVLCGGAWYTWKVEISQRAAPHFTPERQAP